MRTARSQIARAAAFLAMAAIVLVLTGCFETLPVVPARAAIPVQCKEPIPARPAMPTDNLTPESSLDDGVKTMQAEIVLRDGYEVQLVTALTACTAPITGATP